MGIRCYCPNGHKLNVKAEQAGKIGICPKCQVRFQIPFESTRVSQSQKSEENAPAEKNGLPPEETRPVPAEQPAGTPPEPDAWYILGGDNRQYGPVERSVIQSWIREHRVVGGTMVWYEGGPQKEAREYFSELAPSSLPPVAPAGSLPPAEPAVVDELDALRQAARSSQESARQKRVRLSKKNKSRRDLYIVIGLTVVILILLGILIALLTGGQNSPESAAGPEAKPPVSAPAAPQSGSSQP